MLELKVAEGDRVAAGDVDRAARHGRRRARAAARRRPSAIRRSRSSGCCRRARAPKTSVRPPRRRSRRRPTSTRPQAELHAATADVAALRGAARVQRRLAQAARRCGDEAGRGGGAGAARRASGRAPPRSAVARLRAGARPEEIAAARARVAAADAQIAALEKSVADAVVKAPVAGIVTAKLVDAGEMVAAARAVVVVTDLDHAWANVYVDEPVVPRLRSARRSTLVTDAGQRLRRHDHLHLAEGRVHAAQRADRRRALEAGLPHQGDGRQPRRRAEAGHAGRSGDLPGP